MPKKPTPIQPKKGSTKNVKKPPLPMPKKNTLPVQTKNNIVSLPSIKNKESNLIENISNLKEKE